MKWGSWSNLALGLWLIAAPWALHFHVRAPMTEDVVVGVTLVMISLWSANADLTVAAPAWASAALGAWVLAAHRLLGYRSAAHAVGNDLFVGTLIVAFSLSSAASRAIMVADAHSRPL